MPKKEKLFHNIFSKEEKPKKEILGKKVLIDYREKNSFVPSELIKLDLNIEFLPLKVGDYIIGQTTIERKTFQDFISSMINKRIFKQLEEIKQSPQSLLIIEGYDLRLLEDSSLSPNALRGLILSITLKYQIPIIFTRNEEETAKYIQLIANKKEKEIPLNFTKRNLSKKEELQHIIEAFPNIGPVKAKKLLEKFQTLQNLFNSSEKDLEKILGKKAKEFKEIIERTYFSSGIKAKKL
jgi:ERCC4-type nuclease